MKTTLENTPLTDLEKGLAAKLATASFPPATASKRFACGLADGYIKELSGRGRKFLAFVVHRFRRQYQLTKEEQAYVDQWINWRSPVKDFFPKSTVEASCWCRVCRRDTLHQVHGGRPHACCECLKRLENPPLPGIVEPEPEQIEMFSE